MFKYEKDYIFYSRYIFLLNNNLYIYIYLINNKLYIFNKLNNKYILKKNI